MAGVNLYWDAKLRAARKTLPYSDMGCTNGTGACEPLVAALSCHPLTQMLTRGFSRIIRMHRPP